jgi:isoleucyl-tRNA synthetase
MTESNLPALEEKILKFWKENRIFEKSLARKRGSKPFRFFEGPPTANAGPGIHHMLSRIFKDIVCRYKTMRGFYVERKAGWDTHGLPVELQIEKELGIKHKFEIEKFGIAEFNKKAKESVWRYKEEWEKFTERIGFWLDMAHPYITYEASYIESLWWIISKFWRKNLLELDFKVVPYCPRCETPLSSHEVALGYKTVKDPSVYVKFEILKPKSRSKEYLLVWTTTPWTLPANVSVAANPSATYTKYKINGALYWSATPPPFSEDSNVEVIEKRSGKFLVGIKYKAPFRTKPKNKKAFSVVGADFVSTQEGTGFVHIAPAFGEEDMELTKKENLPIILNVSKDGKFSFKREEINLEPFFKKINKKFVKEADPIILEELKKRGILYQGSLDGTEHEYPFCWRCSTPLLYYAYPSWFVRMTRLKEALLKNNEKINWIPATLKEGRFGEWLREIKDWAFSRERYWGTPLPIWQCIKCKKFTVVSSLKDLQKKVYKSNEFFIMRHGQSTHILEQYIAAWPENPQKISHLTEEGKKQVINSAKKLAKKKIDIIVSSDLVRMKETVKILKKYLKGAKVIYDPELRELNTGIFNYKPIPSYHKWFKKPIDRFYIAPSGGETLLQAQKRYFNVWRRLNKKYRGKRILIVGHGDPLWLLESKIKGLTSEETLNAEYIEPGEFRKLPPNDLPYNEEGEVDLHRPYIDEILLTCPKCKKPMRRIKEVADVWFDSGAMPFAQWHYPFENKDRIDKNISFPADYISEAVDQTRGWFYTLLAVSTALGYNTPPYLNVVSLGHILDEKGEKMSKSKGNVVNPWEMIAKYGADPIRLYLFTINPPGEPKRFSEKDLQRIYQEVLVLLNVVRFFSTYAPKKINVRISSIKKSALDIWVISKLSYIQSEITKLLDKYEITQAARQILEFIDDLSRWYVRRSRKRFQRPDSNKALEEVSAILGFVLVEFSKVMAPFMPFISEYIWQEITPRFAKKYPESVHLINWSTIKSPPLAQHYIIKMNSIRELASMGLSLRQSAGIKVRQPLSKFSILKKPDTIRLDGEFLKILAEEINVKEITIDEYLPKGPNWIFQESDNWKVALNNYISEELKEEGEFRDLIRNIQEMRQEISIHPKDKIYLYIITLPDVEKTIKSRISEFKKEVGAKEIFFKKADKFDIIKEYKRADGKEITIAIKKL